MTGEEPAGDMSKAGIGRRGDDCCCQFCWFMALSSPTAKAHEALSNPIQEGCEQRD